MRKVLALPFLPSEHVAQTFESLCEQTSDARLNDLTSYVRETWMASSIWSPGEWTAFMEPVRTNNDVEGWHRRLNQQAQRGQLAFYLLVRLLKNEADVVSLQARLVSAKKLKRFQRKKYAVMQGGRSMQRVYYCILFFSARLYSPNPSST